MPTAATPSPKSAAPTGIVVTGPAPASNIPLPTPTPTPVSEPTPTPSPAISIIESAREKMDAAPSVAFELSFNMSALQDGRTHDIPVTYAGKARTEGYSSAEVAVGAPDGTVETRVIVVDSTVHVFDAAAGGWGSHHGDSPYFVDLGALFGLRLGALGDLTLAGQEVADGVDTYRIEGRLRGLEIAGARGDFDVVYRIGTEDGLVREVSASGQLELDDDTTLIGGVSVEEASIKLTAKLFDHGKRVDIVTPTLAIPRFDHDAVLLQDGRIMVGGGFSGIANNNVIVQFPIGLVQLYEPETGMWTMLEPIEGPGILYSAVNLADGRVLLVGLGIEDDQPAGMASVFDPVSESWRPLPGSSSPRAVPSLALLADGRVLVAGGHDYSGATSIYLSPEPVNVVEILDPHTGEWQQAAAMNRVSEKQWLFSLRDGRVLAIGAVSDESSDAAVQAEVYDPATDTWTLVGSPDSHYAPTDAIEMSDGRLLVVGVLSGYDGQFPEARIYDPASDTWTPGGEMAHARSAATLVPLPDGRVLVAGGEDGWGEGFPPYSTTSVFDPDTLSWSVGPDLAELRGSSSATLLRDGRILLAGGIGMALDIEEVYPLASSEVVDPYSPGMGAPVVTSRQPPFSGCEPPVAPAPGVILPQAESPPQPQEVLDAATEAMGKVESYHMEIAHSITPEADNEEKTSIRLVIDSQSPDRLRTCVSQSDPYGGIEFQNIIIGDVVYTAYPYSGEWEIDEFSGDAFEFLDFTSEEVLSNIREPSVDGLELLNDVKVHRVTGTVAAASLGSTTLLGLGGYDTGELKVVYWIGVDDSLVRRFVAEGRVGLAGDEMVHLFTSVDISDFGRVVVEEPRVGGASDGTVR